MSAVSQLVKLDLWTSTDRGHVRINPSARINTYVAQLVECFDISSAPSSFDDKHANVVVQIIS